MNDVNGYLPGGWFQATGEDLFEFLRGISYKKADVLTAPSDDSVTILRAGNLQDGSIVFDDLVHVPESYVRDEQRIRKGDLIIAMSSGSASVVGKVAVADKDMPRVSFGAFCGLLRPRTQEYSHWLSEFFQTKDYRDLISSLAAGININNLRREHLYDLSIPVPPISEMQRLEKKIEALQERSRRAREALAEVGSLLEQFRQSVLAAAFRGDLTANWRADHPNVEPASELLHRIRAERRRRWKQAELAKYEAKGQKPPKNWQDKYKEPEPVDDSDLPELPERWCWIRLPNLGYMNRGKSRHRPRNATHLYGGPYPFVQTGDIAQSSGRIVSHKQTYSEAGLAQSKLWPAGTVCITIAANIASSAVLSYPACFPDSIVGLISDESLCTPEFVEFFIRTAKSDLERFAPSTAQKNINLETLTEVAVPLPPLEESKEITRLLTELIDSAFRIDGVVAASLAEQIDQLDQAILAKAFRGELVPQDPNDEPASALLARIREQKTQQAEAIKGKKRTTNIQRRADLFGLA